MDFRPLERKTRLNIRIVGIDSGVVSVSWMETARQIIGTRIAHIPAVMGVLFSSGELDRYRITVGLVAQTNVCATMAGLPPGKASRIA